MSAASDVPPPPLRVVVADDEPLIREGLAALLAAEPGVTVVAVCDSGASALAAAAAHRPDVLFLDVRMPGLDGVAAARALADAAAQAAAQGGAAGAPPPAVVFATAHDRYALAAFDVGAADYLLKPFDAGRVREALRRVRARRAAAAPGGAALPHAPRFAERLVVGVAGGARVVPVAEVEWVEAADNYVQVHAADGGGLLREPLRDLERRLDPARFARVHRSALVNLARVRGLRSLASGDYELTMRSGATVPLSRTYRDAVLGRLG